MNNLVDSARRYAGVPFRHRGRSERGVDCVGLLLLAYRDCGVDLPDFRLYGREPHQNGLVERIANALGAPVMSAPVHRELLRVGDVIVRRYDLYPHHVALVTDYRFGGLAMIHADGHNKRVIEHRLPDDVVRHITHVFRRPV